MKTFSTILFAVATLLPLAPASRGAEASAYAIADATSDHLLESVGGDKKLQIASLTKIATAMVVLDWAEGGKRDLGAVVPIPKKAKKGSVPSIYNPPFVFEWYSKCGT